MSKGFTLIEALAVVSIIAILSGIFLANYHTFGEDLKLQRSAYQLAQEIRRVAEMALSAKDIGLDDNSGGYGIYINKKAGKIIIFADCNKNSKYDERVKNCSNKKIHSEKIEEISLEKGVKVDSLEPSNSSLTIIFKPPNPIIVIGSGNNSTTTIKIALDSDTSKTREIKVNKAGLIEVD